MINAQELVQQTSNLFRFGKFKEAEVLIKRTLKQDPNCFEARLEQIRSALFQDETQVAFNLIGEAVAIHPNDPRLVALQGIWFLENKEFKGAEAALSWAAKALPEDAQIRLNWAIALRNLGKIAEAQEQILKSISLNPASELAHFEYSRLLMLQGQQREAALQILKCLECNIRFIPGFIALTQYLRMKKDLNAAILLFKDAIRMAPDMEFFYGQLALLYEETGNYAAALPLAEHLAKTNKSYYDDLRVGIYTFLSGNPKKAAIIFQKCIKRDPNKWDAYYNLGEISLTQNKTEEAKEFFQKAYERAGSIDSRPSNQLGVIALSKSELQAAEEYFKKAILINPSSFEATLNLALVFKKAKNPTQANAYAEKAYALAKENPARIYAVQKFLATN